MKQHHTIGGIVFLCLVSFGLGVVVTARLAGQEHRVWRRLEKTRWTKQFEEQSGRLSIREMGLARRLRIATDHPSRLHLAIEQKLNMSRHPLEPKAAKPFIFPSTKNSLGSLATFSNLSSPQRLELDAQQTQKAAGAEQQQAQKRRDEKLWAEQARYKEKANGSQPDDEDREGSPEINVDPPDPPDPDDQGERQLVAQRPIVLKRPMVMPVKKTKRIKVKMAHVK